MYSFLVSILIGIGVVLPGVSGSAIAILVGIYDKVLTVLNDSSIKTLKKISFFMEFINKILYYIYIIDIDKYQLLKYLNT